MSGTIFLVRHGQTALNAQGRFRGRQDPPLDDRGLVETADATRQLLGMGIRAVYTSPLLRAVQTAQLIARACGSRLTKHPGLTDLDHGRWEGLTPAEAAERDPEAFRRFRQNPRNAAAPGGERLVEVERRLFSALTSIADHHVGEAVAAVSHEIPIRLVIAGLAGIEGPALWDVPLPTGAVTRLRYERGSLALEGEVLMGEEA